jgi:hypothetical protein
MAGSAKWLCGERLGRALPPDCQVAAVGMGPTSWKLSMGGTLLQGLLAVEALPKRSDRGRNAAKRAASRKAYEKRRKGTSTRNKSRDNFEAKRAGVRVDVGRDPFARAASRRVYEAKRRGGKGQADFPTAGAPGPQAPPCIGPRLQARVCSPPSNESGFVWASLKLEPYPP